MGGLHAHLCTICMQYPKRPEESVGSSAVGVTGACELANMGAGNLKPLQEQYVLLTTESSLQYVGVCVCMCVCYGVIKNEIQSIVNTWC